MPLDPSSSAEVAVDAVAFRHIMARQRLTTWRLREATGGRVQGSEFGVGVHHGVEGRGSGIRVWV